MPKEILEVYKRLQQGNLSVPRIARSKPLDSIAISFRWLTLMLEWECYATNVRYARKDTVRSNTMMKQRAPPAERHALNATKQPGKSSGAAAATFLYRA
ncbi:hypothetical protein VTL71DRAFT_6008 [Oculimacula yallundae]|uniref:Uncharacterized protein n=1 Tax=Oculimacula yallundae TaxID=86028 RepID=A0ABR4BZ44_9HELO